MKGKRKMKFNKVIREYVSAELDKKRIAANREFRAEYEARRKAASDEIEALIESIKPAISEVLSKYGMDEDKYRWDGVNEGKTIEHIVSFYDTDIRNHKEFEVIRDHESKLYSKQKDMEKNIELECALGADKEAFQKMLAEISF